MNSLRVKLVRWVLANFRTLAMLPILGAIGLIWLAFNRLELKDAFLAMFGALQFIVVYLLFLVTSWYARETAKIGKSSGEAAESSAAQAEASKAMAEEMRQQRLNASQPVIWPTISWNPNDKCLDVYLGNIGNGPALDVDIFVGRGKEPAIADCEHEWFSYIVQGGGVHHRFFRQSPLKQFDPDALLGEYTVFVEWRDLHSTGPFFQARLSADLVRDATFVLSAEHQKVNITSISAKRMVLS
jgi:hypothetical protein